MSYKALLYQYKPHTVRNQLLVVLLTGVITALLFALVLLILPKPDDGIPWAKSTQGIPAPSHALFNSFLRTFIVVMTTNVLIWGYFTLRKIQKLSLLVFTMIIASAGGLFFSTLPVANDMVWRIIITFHLKRQDQYLDGVINLLYGFLTIGVGLGIGLLISSLFFVNFREKRPA